MVSMIIVYKVLKNDPEKLSLPIKQVYFDAIVRRY